MLHNQPNFEKWKTKQKHGFVLQYYDQFEVITPDICIVIYLFIHLR